MTCCVCHADNPTVETILPQKLEYASEPVDIAQDPVLGPSKPRRLYRTCAGACELKIEHAAGWHANVSKSGCLDCNACPEMYEIRQLSNEAQGLILHRLRNSLTIASGHAHLLATMEIGINPMLAKDRAQTVERACVRLSREITELFGGL